MDVLLKRAVWWYSRIYPLLDPLVNLLFVKASWWYGTAPLSESLFIHGMNRQPTARLPSVPLAFYYLSHIPHTDSEQRSAKKYIEYRGPFTLWFSNLQLPHTHTRTRHSIFFLSFLHWFGKTSFLCIAELDKGTFIYFCLINNLNPAQPFIHWMNQQPTA